MTEQEKAAREALGIEQENKVDKFVQEETMISDETEEVQKPTPKKDIVTIVGFVPISRESLPSKSLFYDNDIAVTIKAATTAEIKHYSSMDDEDPMEVNRHVADILNTCCKVIKGDSVELSYKDLSDFDKVYTFFAIRDRTFLAHKRESNLTNKSECPHCGHKNSKNISNETFGYYDIPKSVMKYYNELERCFVLSDESLGKEPLKIYVPTVGVTEKIVDYIRRKEIEKQSGEGGYYNANDLTIIMYTTPDWRFIDDKDKYIKSRLRELENWKEERYLLATEMTKRLKIGIKPTISYKCEKCGGEIKAAIRFQRWGTLLSAENIISRFFEDSESDDSEQDN